MNKYQTTQLAMSHSSRYAVLDAADKLLPASSESLESFQSILQFKGQGKNKSGIQGLTEDGFTFYQRRSLDSFPSLSKEKNPIKESSYMVQRSPDRANSKVECLSCHYYEEELMRNELLI